MSETAGLLKVSTAVHNCAQGRVFAQDPDTCAFLNRTCETMKGKDKF